MNHIELGATVTLEVTEIMTAALAGVMRRTRAIKKNLHATANQPEKWKWQSDIEGALGECAFAKLVGVYWNDEGFNSRLDGDVVGIEIKTRPPTKGELYLIVRPGELHATRKYVLMNGVNGIYRYCGWCFGRECNQEKTWFRTAGEWDTRPPCWWVPVSELRGDAL